jgi:nucleoside-diphosphate-sugar epimerase
MFYKILITGGAGYIGSVLIPMLLNEGHEVTVYDNVSYDPQPLIPHFSNKNFHFIRGDILDKKNLKEVVKGKDIIIHLAALVGFPLCDKKPDLARRVNIEGTKLLIDTMSDEQLLFYSSTGSNYGKIKNLKCDEDSPLNPTSLYGITKTESEGLCMSRKNSISYRFATAFGTSPRLRLDLLVNDLTYLAQTQGYIVVYQPEFIRSFIHVQDMAKSFLLGVQKWKKMIGNSYNIGSDKMSYSKQDVCEIISRETKCLVYYENFDYDRDHRNYEVSYEKIKKLGFDTTKTVEDGVKELIKVYKLLNLYDRKYYNIGE